MFLSFDPISSIFITFWLNNRLVIPALGNSESATRDTLVYLGVFGSVCRCPVLPVTGGKFLYNTCILVSVFNTFILVYLLVFAGVLYC